MSSLGELVVKLHNWKNGVAKHKASIQKTAHPLRAGALSAAAINWTAFFDPVESHPDVVLTAVAARSLAKAQAQIAKYSQSKAKAYGSYEELLADPDIDVVYIALPNGLHMEWAIKAMEAGKHVLVEKPITATADEVDAIKECSVRTNRVVLEAFHWQFYPAAHMVRDLIKSGEYGQVKNVRAVFEIPGGAIGPDDVRLQYDLAGGASMDLCYIVSAACYLCGEAGQTVDVLKAEPKIHATEPRIDEAMTSELVLKLPDERQVTCNLFGNLKQPKFLGIIPKYWDAAPKITIELEKGQIQYNNFVAPYLNHAITIKSQDGSSKTVSQYEGGPDWSERGARWWTSYRYQLEAFVDMVRAHQEGKETGHLARLDRAKETMSVIDAIYDKAGLPRRVSAPFK